MSKLNPLKPKFNKKNEEYFIQLVHIAIANSVLSTSEMDLLHRMGKKLGIADFDIDKLIEKVLALDYDPPEQLFKRFEKVYGFIKMTLADGEIDRNEMRLVFGFIAKAGFPESDIPSLLVLLIRGIRQNKNAEELFRIYIK